MNLAQILAQCEHEGIELSVDEGNLAIAFDTPPSETLITLLRDNKPQLIAFIDNYQQQNQQQNQQAAGQPLTAVNRDDPDFTAPLSYAQQRLWLIDQIEQGSAEYHLSWAMAFDGHFDQQVAEQALSEIIRRHESLRTVFLPCDGEQQVRQQILNDFDFCLYSEDLSKLETNQQSEAINRLIKRDSQQAFDLRHDLMLRAGVYWTTANQGQLLFTVHHIACDGWSIGILVKEFSALYQAFSLGQPSPLSPLALQYLDFAQWQRLWLADTVLDSQLGYWKQQLKGVPSLHNLPLDHERPATKSHVGELVGGRLDAGLNEQLQQLARAHHVTPFMLLHAAIGLVLSLHSNSNDMVIGTAVANRMAPGLEPLIGFFVNTLVLRTDTSDRPFTAYLEHVKAVNLAAQANQDVPFEYLVDHCGVPRSSQYTPLFQILFSMNTNEAGQLNLPGLSLSAAPGLAAAAKFDLQISAEPDDDGLAINWLFDCALFSRETVERFHHHLQRLLSTIVATPNVSIGQLAVLSVKETHHLVSELNDTRTGYHRDLLMHQQFEAQAHHHPEHIALVFAEQSLSYRDLNSAANRLGHYLHQQGVGADTLVALCVERSPIMVIAMLAILKAGGAYVPLDPGYPLARLESMLNDSGAKWLLSESAVLECLNPDDTVNVVNLEQTGLWSACADSDLEAVQTTASDLAYVIYTSGSTGVPKGVMIEHRSVLNFFAGLDQALGAPQQQAVWAAVTSLSFDICIVELLWTLSHGCKVVLQPARPQPVGATTAMDFSLFYFAAEGDSGHNNPYELLLEGAKFADGHEFAGVWVPERHFSNFGDQFPNPSVAAAAVAATTRQVTIRSGSVVLPLHDPIRVAEEWSMVDNLSNGRVALSFAPGWHPNDFVFAPDNYAERQQIMRDGIDTIQKLWQGGSLNRNNGLGKAIDIHLHPKPVQNQLPIWITASGNPETFRYAGSIGANLLTHMLGQDQKALQEKISVYRSALVAAGFTATHGKVALMLHTFVGDNLDTIEQTVEEPFKNYLRESINLIKPLADEAGLDLDKDRDAIIDMAFARYYHSSGLFGTPESCLARVQALQAIGVDEIACLIDFGIDNQTTLTHLPGIYQLQQTSRQLAAQQRLMATRLAQSQSLETLMTQHQVTHLQTTPSYLQELVLAPSAQPLLGSLQQLLVGGEPLPPVLAQTLASRVTGKVFNMYGPTETTIWSSVATVTGGEVTIGRPIANTRFYVVGDNQQLLPKGVIGELYIGGDGLSRGYLQHPNLTAEQFLSLPFAPERLYKTGDLVRWLPDGRLQFVGRNNSQVKYRGFRIELAEIEHQLADDHNVTAAVVLVREETPGEQRLVGYIVAAAAEADLSERLKQQLKLKLPEHMIPAVIITLAALPLTDNGKVDRQALPLPDRQSLAGIYMPPRGDSEQQMQQIWAELLQLECKDLSVTASFFELGGHSLLAVRLVARIRLQLGLDLAVKDIFTAPSVRELSALVDQSTAQLPLRSPVTATARDEGEALVLSFAQQRLWFIDRMDGSSAQYNMPIALTVEGPFDVLIAQQAIRQIITRHESLRTVFAEQQNGPVQFVNQHYDFTLQQIDLSAQTSAVQKAEVQRLRRQEGQQPFDLSNDLMLRASYLQLTQTGAQQQGILLFTMHHIASDGWSVTVFEEEFVSLYQAFVTGNASPLPALDVQYADYARWQRDWLQGEALTAQLDYWGKQLADTAPVHGLVLDHQRPAQKSAVGGLVSSRLSVALSEQLQQLANAQQVTVFMLLHAALGLVLSRHSNRHDIVIGTPVANRMQQELEPLIGFFVNMLVLRVNTNYDHFDDYLQQVKEVNLAAQANQDVPFEQLLEHCQVSRSSSFTPLFQITLSMNNHQTTELSLPGLQFAGAPGAEVVAKFDLDISAEQSKDGLKLSWIYDQTLFTAATIERFDDHLQRLLTNIVAQPSAALVALPMLSLPEKQQLLEQFNDTAKPGITKEATAKLISQRFETQAALTPDALAVTCENQRLSYRALNAAANRLSHYLRAQGVGRQTLVGLCVDRSVTMVVAILAVLKAGGAYVPLDLDHPAERLQLLLGDTGLKILLSDGSLDQTLDLAADIQLTDLTDIDLTLYSDDNPEPLDSQQSDDLAYITYTSGSTGLPKGVMIAQHSVLNLACDNRFIDINRCQGFLALSNVAFDGSVFDLFVPLLNGKSLVIVPREKLMNATYWQSVCAKNKVNTVFMTTALFNFMAVEHPEVLSDFEQLLFGGEQANQARVLSFIQRYPQHSLIHVYGPTETTVYASYTPLTLDNYTKLPIGRPLSGKTLYVLDSQMQLLPRGAVGELYIGGDGVARGYLNRDELSQQCFVANPFVADPAARLYRSGDLVRYLDDGQLVFIGRRDNQLKIRGFRIEPGEIEEQLTHCEGVDSALVTVDNGAEEPRLVAYVVSDDDAQTLAGQLRQSLHSRLPAYLMPAAFVVIKRWPLNANGKIRLSMLPPADFGRGAYIAPEAGIEQQLAVIWAKLLKLDVETISATGNFFELGGHSLLVTKLIGEIHNQTGIELAIKAVFVAGTLRRIGEDIELLSLQQFSEQANDQQDNVVEMEI